MCPPDFGERRRHLQAVQTWLGNPFPHRKKSSSQFCRTASHPGIDPMNRYPDVTNRRKNEINRRFPEGNLAHPNK